MAPPHENGDEHESTRRLRDAANVVLPAYRFAAIGAGTAGAPGAAGASSVSMFRPGTALLWWRIWLAHAGSSLRLNGFGAHDKISFRRLQ